MIRLVRNYVTVFIGFFMCMYVTLRWKHPNFVESGVRLSKEWHDPFKLDVKKLDINIFDSVRFGEMQKRDLEYILHKTLIQGHFDEKARYKMFPNAFVAENYYKLAKEPACVALQSTYDRVSSVRRFLQNWPGSVSFALFAPSYYFYFAVVYIKHLRKCHKDVRNQVTWHLSHPKLLAPLAKHALLLRLEFNCSTPEEEIFKTLTSSVNTISGKKVPFDLLYPQNAMRNLARQHCKTRWVMCPDVDMVFPDPLPPRSNLSSMYSRLNAFLRSEAATECYKCAFVFPLYEVADLGHGHVPSSKQELLRFKENGSAQIYHVEAFEENQRCSNLSVWEKMPLRDEIQIAAPINFSFWYEPVYVVQQGSPRFDERYVGYGFTRNSQALEMTLAGYEFHLLDTIFLSHLWGLKKKKTSKTVDRFRASQAWYNSKVFFTYHVRELAIRYDEDLGDLLHVRPDQKFNREFNVVIEVNKVNKTVDEIMALLSAFVDRVPGSYGF